MVSTWQTITLPSTVTSGGTFSPDVMLLLTDGSVFIHNRGGNEWLRFFPDPLSGYAGAAWLTQFTESDMANTRQYFASGVLKDGRVFAIGGEDSDAGGDTPLGEIFDPQTNLWTAIAKPSPAFDFVRGDCNGSVLSDGRVLLGGASLTEPPSTWSNRTAIWDPSNNSWIEAGLQNGALSNTDKEDPFEEESFALLPDGSVLVPAVRDTPKAQTYVPSSDDWKDCNPSPVNLAINAIGGTIVDETGPIILLPDGRAFVVGGTGQTAVFTPGPNPGDPGSWTVGPTLPADTSASPNWPTLTALDAPACLLPNGKVVLMGGTTTPLSGDFFSKDPVFFEYDPNSTATTMPNLDVQPTLPPSPGGSWTWSCNLLLLPTGQLLCACASFDPSFFTLPGPLLLYTPDPLTQGSPAPSWRPANISVPTTMLVGYSYTLSGTQINGLSQAVAYGDDNGMATNYPIVRLTDPSTSPPSVFYLRSYNFLSMGVATGSTVQTCTIDIPSNFGTGCDRWNLEVIANGIPSVSVPITIQPRPSESWAVSWGAGRLDVFGAGENNDDLLQRSWTTPLPPPTSLGGTLGMIYPSAVSSNTGRLDVFGAGENRDLLQWSFNGIVANGWAGPVSLGGTLGNLFPSAVSWGPGRLDVFGAGGNSELLQWTSVDGGISWAVPVSFDSGMWTNSKPCVVSWGPGRLDVFGVGFNHELLHRWFDTTTGPAGNVESLGGNLLFSTSQSAVSSKTGHLDVFGVGENNELLYWSFDSTTGWTGPVSFDSGMWTPSKPCVVSSCSGRLNVFGEGENNVLLHKLFDPATGWNAAESLGGTLLTGAAPAAVSSNARQLDVFGLGQNHDLLHWSSVDDGSSWTTPVSLDPGIWRSDVD
jgi:hypothetical protein